MKHKAICGIGLLLVLFLLTGCDTQAHKERIEKTLAYSELLNMKTWPEQYVGKTRTVSGLTATQYYAVTDATYYILLVSNADGSYSESIEYLLTDGTYPKDGENVSVTGEFEVYYENTLPYYRLKDAHISKKGNS